MNSTTGTGLSRPDASTGSLITWALVALAYAIAFMQRMSPQTINDSLAVAFSTTPQGVAAVTSAYFLGYTAMQFPAGILVDSYGPRRVILGSLLVSAAGTLLFAVSDSVLSASMARAMVAFGDAVVFTCLVKLVALSFSDKTFGTMSGLSQLSGYVGGLAATAPLAAAVGAVGWRASFGAVGVVLLSLLPMLWACMPETGFKGSVLERLYAVLRSARHRLGQRASWGAAFTFSSHFIPITTLSGVWGIPMLMQEFQLGRTQASHPMMVMMIATMAGSFFFGFVSDRVPSIFTAQMAMIATRTLGFALLLPAVVQRLGMPFTVVVLAVLGFVGGGTVPFLLKSLKRIYTAETIGVGGSINTTVAGVLMVVAQPLVAHALSSPGPASPGLGTERLPALDFSAMVIVLTVISASGFVGPCLMRKAIKEPAA